MTAYVLAALFKETKSCKMTLLGSSKVLNKLRSRFGEYVSVLGAFNFRGFKACSGSEMGCVRFDFSCVCPHPPAAG